MNIHEYQAKIILQKYGIPVPPFAVIDRMEDIDSIIEKLDIDQAVVKIQVHAGGRGKGGGVKLAKSRPQIKEYARQLLGMKLVNEQTGPEGVIAHQVLISPILDYRKEFYAGAVIDRKRAQAVLIISPEGGMDIEEVAHHHPEKVLTMPIPLNGRLRSYQLIELCKFMGWKGAALQQGKQLLASLARAFIDTDASLLEINPLVETREGNLQALDAKLSVDDNAVYRQKELASFFDPTQVNPAEVRAKQFDLSYVALDGNIGCMVNGAGLAMSTMDIVHLHGGKPANFLDVGGGASKEKVAEGFKIILSDPNVKAILINIFGGIMNCETIAEGIISAASDLQVRVPLIVRMEGTNVEQGKKLFADSPIPIILANDLSDAAEKAVKASLQSKMTCANTKGL